MKKIVLALLGILFCFQVNAENSIDSLNQRVDTLKWKIEELKSETQKNLGENYSKSVDSATNNIGNMLAIFSAILTLVSIVLVFYVTRILTQIQEQRESVEKNIKEWEKIKEVFENLPDVAYHKINAVENTYIFKRLERYPEDIYNWFSRLATRGQLESQYFEKLVTCYKKLPEFKIIYTVNEIHQRIVYKPYCLNLLLQHFTKELFCDAFMYDQLFLVFPTDILRDFSPPEQIDITEKITSAFIDFKDVDSIIERYKKFLIAIKDKPYYRELDLEGKIKEILQKSWKIELWNSLNIF